MPAMIAHTSRDVTNRNKNCTLLVRDGYFAGVEIAFLTENTKY